MKKRILSLLLCAVMIVGLMPMSVSALEEDKYPYVAGTQITPANAENVLGDGKVSYDPEENVLTLKNATITAGSEPYGIYAEGDLLIELVGENKITSSEASAQNICAAVYSKNGNIRIFAGDNSDDAVLIAEASLQNSETDYSSYGIYGQDIFVEDGVKVIAESGDASLQNGFKSCGISGDAISITNAAVNAVAGSGCYSYAIEGRKGITIENSDVIAQSNSEVVFWENYNVLQSGGIIAPAEGDIHISGGTTEMLLCRGYEVLSVLGGSEDLYAGQAVDRVGVRLGFLFPAGQYVSELAQKWGEPVRPKVSVRGMNCSLSGLENQCDALMKKEAPAEQVAHYCLSYIAQTVLKMIQNARELYPGLPVVCAGGVMSSDVIRGQVSARAKDVFFVPGKFSSDNAIGAALIAANEVGQWNKQ